MHHPLQSPPVLRGAITEPGSDASCLDTLPRTSVEVLKDSPGDSELPQLPEVIEALLRRGSCVQGEGSGGVFAHPDDLGPGG